MAEKKSEPAYIASAWLATLVEDLRRRELLEGEVRESVAQSLEQFRLHGGGDPQEVWNIDLLDLYEEMHGHQPEAP